MSAISVLQVKFNVEFTRQVVNFSWIAYIKPSGETKRFVFLWAKPVHKQWKLFQSLFRMKTTFISNSWRKKCLTFHNLHTKIESAKYGVIWDKALIETFFHYFWCRQSTTAMLKRKENFKYSGIKTSSSYKTPVSTL